VKRALAWALITTLMVAGTVALALAVLIALPDA
jgi:hypothetical protein